MSTETVQVLNLDGFIGYDVQSEKTPQAFIICISLFVMLSIGCFAPVMNYLNQRRKLQHDSERKKEQHGVVNEFEENTVEVNEEQQTSGALVQHKMIELSDGIYMEQFMLTDVAQDKSIVTDNIVNNGNMNCGQSTPMDDSTDSVSKVALERIGAIKSGIEASMNECGSTVISKQENVKISTTPDVSTTVNPVEHFMVNEYLGSMSAPVTNIPKNFVSSTPTNLNTNVLENDTDYCNGPRFSDRLSNAPSAATTSRLHDGLQRKMTKSTLMKKRQKDSAKFMSIWSRDRVSSRQETLERSVKQERQYVKQILLHAVQAPDDGLFQPTMNHNLRGKFSEAAGSVLQGSLVEGEAAYYCRKFPAMRSSTSLSRRNSGRTTSQSSFVEASENASIMPPLEQDALAPEDAASNIFDPGRTGIPIPYPEYLARLERDRTEQLLLDHDQSAFSARFAAFLDLAEADHETKRIFTLTILSTIGAVSDPLVRLILVAVISYAVNTNSMVAYVLVNVILRVMTEEISGAIGDAESNMLQDAILLGGEFGWFQAGQIMQLAILMQLMIMIPVLVLWIFLIDNVVLWLVRVEDISHIASEYTAIIIIDYMLRGVTKTFMLPFYVSGQAQFEVKIDFVATVLLTTAIGVILGTSDGQNSISLSSIGWIQVIIGVAATISKIAVVIVKGWLNPFRRGLIQKLSLKDSIAIKRFLLHAMPQFLGSMVELAEWDVLTLFVRHLGGAEVAAWAIMGIVWQVFFALADGLGDASSARVSFYLTEGMPSDARHLSHKVVCMTFTMVLIVTSGFLMLGPRLAVLLTTDATLQNLLNNLIGMTGLANVSMTVAQLCWSLSGAQGRFEMASATILFCRWLIILPLAAVVVFQFNYDPSAVAGVIAAGYAVAAWVLSCSVFGSEWENLHVLWQEQELNTNCFQVNDGEVDEELSNSQDDDVEDESDFSASLNESSCMNRQVV